MIRSSWRVIHVDELDCGLRYVVRSGEREIIVLCQAGGYQGYNSETNARCEVSGAVKDAIRNY